MQISFQEFWERLQLEFRMAFIEISNIQLIIAIVETHADGMLSERKNRVRRRRNAILKISGVNECRVRTDLRCDGVGIVLREIHQLDARKSVAVRQAYAVVGCIKLRGKVAIGLLSRKAHSLLPADPLPNIHRV